MMRDQKLWSWHVLAGVVILLLLGLHMVIMHLDAIVNVLNPAGGEPVSWANVVARGKMLFFPVTYVILLGAALFHGLYGLRTMLFELNPPSVLKRVVAVLILIVGIGLFAYGTWAAVESFWLARSL